MEIFNDILLAIYSLFAQLTIVWPVAFLLLGLILMFEPSKTYKKYARRAFVVAALLGILLIAIQVAGYVFGMVAMPYQQVGVGIYYVVMLIGVLSMIRTAKSVSRK